MQHSLRSRVVEGYMMAMRQYHAWARMRLGTGVHATRESIMIDGWNTKVNWLITVGLDDDNVPILGMYDEPHTDWFHLLPWQSVTYGHGQITLNPLPLIVEELDTPITVQPLVVNLSDGHVMHMRKSNALRIVRFTCDAPQAPPRITHRNARLLEQK